MSTSVKAMAFNLVEVLEMFQLDDCTSLNGLEFGLFLSDVSTVGAGHHAIVLDGERLLLIIDHMAILKATDKVTGAIAAVHIDVSDITNPALFTCFSNIEDLTLPKALHPRFEYVENRVTVLGSDDRDRPLYINSVYLYAQIKNADALRGIEYTRPS